MRKKRVYLCGPMSRIPEFNFPAFDAAAADGRARGFEVVSPADLDRAAGFDPNHHGEIDSETLRAIIDRDLKALFTVEAIAVLPGWDRGSRGAAAEVAVARWLGLEILDATTWEPLVSHTICPAPANIPAGRGMEGQPL